MGLRINPILQAALNLAQGKGQESSPYEGMAPAGQPQAAATPTPSPTPGVVRPDVAADLAAAQGMPVAPTEPQYTPAPPAPRTYGTTGATSEEPDDTSPYQGMTPAGFQGPPPGSEQQYREQMGLAGGGQAGPITDTQMTVRTQKGVPGLAKLSGEMTTALDEVREESKKYQEALVNFEAEVEADPRLKDYVQRRKGVIDELTKRMSPEENEKFYNRISEIRKRQDEALQRASKEVDPGKFWREKSNGEKVLAAISILASGFGQGWSGNMGENGAWKIIDNAIARDIQAQEFNIESARQEAAELGRSVAEEYQLNDWAIEKILQQKTMYDMAITQEIEDKLRKTTNAEKRYNLTVALSEAQLRLSNSMAALLEKSADNEIIDVTTKMMTPKRDLKSEMELRKLKTGWGIAPDAPEAAKIRLADISYRTSMDILDRLEKFVERSGTDPNNPKERGEVDILIFEFIKIQQSMATSGTLNEGEYRVFLENSPITKGYFDPWKSKDKAMGLIEAAKNSMGSIASNTAAAYFPNGDAQFSKGPHTDFLQQLYLKKTGNEYRAKEY